MNSGTDRKCSKPVTRSSGKPRAVLSYYLYPGAVKELVGMIDNSRYSDRCICHCAHTSVLNATGIVYVQRRWRDAAFPPMPTKPCFPATSRSYSLSLYLIVATHNMNASKCRSQGPSPARTPHGALFSESLYGRRGTYLTSRLSKNP